MMANFEMLFMCESDFNPHQCFQVLLNLYISVDLKLFSTEYFLLMLSDS